jgi:hypothetical protein
MPVETPARLAATSPHQAVEPAIRAPSSAVPSDVILRHIVTLDINFRMLDKADRGFISRETLLNVKTGTTNGDRNLCKAAQFALDRFDQIAGIEEGLRTKSSASGGITLRNLAVMQALVSSDAEHLHLLAHSSPIMRRYGRNGAVWGATLSTIALVAIDAILTCGLSFATRSLTLFEAALFGSLFGLCTGSCVGEMIGEFHCLNYYASKFGSINGTESQLKDQAS